MINFTPMTEITLTYLGVCMTTFGITMAAGGVLGP